MSTTIETRAPQSAAEHAAEARRLLRLVTTDAIGAMDNAEYTAVFARDPHAVAAVASAHLALAQLEEQRTANKIAAYQAELIVNPYGVGTREHDKWWVDFGAPITEAVTA